MSFLSSSNKSYNLTKIDKVTFLVKSAILAKFCILLHKGQNAQQKAYLYQRTINYVK